jgi:predicted metal-dependent phosphoesterase TrpH
MANQLTVRPHHNSASLTPEAKTLWDVFTTLTEDSCPRFYNFHLHTVFSDGQLDPIEVINQAIAIGMEGLTITDHHSVEGYEAAQAYLQMGHLSQEGKPKLWTGIEISTPLLEVEVHILGFGFDLTHPQLFPYVQGHTPKGAAYEPERTIEAIHAAGGLAVLAHPARYRRPVEKLVAAAVELGIDGLETYYAYGNPSPWRPSLDQMQEVYHLAQTYGLFSTCGTDSHGLSIQRRV